MDRLPLEDVTSFEGREVRFGVMGSGPNVVMVHGTPWSSFNLRHIIHGLAQDQRVYYYDLLGYGQSDKRPGDVSLGAQNRVLTALIRHWELDAPIAIGHDFGGATILRAHLLDQVAFSRIVLIDPVALSPWGSEFFMHVRKHEAAFAGVPEYIHDALLRAYITTAAHQPIPEAVMDEIVAPWIGTAGKAAFYHQIAQADSAYTDEVEPFYPSIEIPVQILWGENDAWIPPNQAYALHDAIPNSELTIVPDAGHLVIEERPDQLLQAIRSFLSATSSTRHNS